MLQPSWHEWNPNTAAGILSESILAHMRWKIAFVVFALAARVLHGQASNVASPAKNQNAPTLAAAQEMVRRGQLQQAAGTLEQLEKEQPPPKGVAHELGIVYYRSGKL